MDEDEMPSEGSWMRCSNVLLNVVCSFILDVSVNVFFTGLM